MAFRQIKSPALANQAVINTKLDVSAISGHSAKTSTALSGTFLLLDTDTNSLAKITAGSLIGSFTTNNLVEGTGESANLYFTPERAQLAVAADISDAVAAEAALRVAADNTLTTAINNEVSRATSAEATLTSNLATELTSRANADTTLQANIDAEATARAAADTTIILAATALTGRVTVNESDIADLEVNLAQEVSDRIAGDNALSSALTTETNARASADTTLQTNITTEATTRAAADTALQTAIDNEVTARTNADTALDGRLTSVETEMTATQTGSGLSTSGAYSAIGVYDADTNATGGFYIGGATSLANADKLLDSALKVEETARIEGDNALDARLDVIEGDATTAGSVAKALADAQAYADQAEVDAKAYTDTRESAITTAYEAADTVLQTAIDTKLAASSYTAADVLTKIKTVDGAGSGLDADLLDGQSGAYYLNWTNVTNKPDPVITVTLTGDVTGTANTTLTDLASGTVSVSTTIAANSVALGTDTTGNYMVNVAAGTDISVSHTQGEGSTATVSNTSTLDSVTGRGASTTNGITVGSVTVDSVNTMDGTTSTVASTNVSDTIIDKHLL